MMMRLMMLAAMMVVALPIMAATEVVDGITWTYTVSNGKASVGGVLRIYTAVPKSTSGAITIPSTLGGYPVTSIWSSAFDGCSGLTSVTLPDSVTSIGSYAFSGCSGLTSVTIGSGVTSIGDRAFSGCSGLMSFLVAEDNASYMSVAGLLLTKDGKKLVLGINVNGDVVIPDSVTSIGDYAFYGCSGLTSVTIPDGVTSIEGSAFYGCSGLTSVTIPDGVTSIGHYAFYGCSGLTSVTISDSVTSIGSFAFSGCSSLKEIEFPASVVSFGDTHGERGSDGCYNLRRMVFKGAPPVNVRYYLEADLADFDGSKIGCVYPREYGAQWQKIVGLNNFNGYLTVAAPKVEVISSAIRENDPTIMDVVYKVTSCNPTVKVRVLAFEDGERSFAKVVRPETFIEGTAANVGDEVAANVEHTLSWQVSSDWQTRLAKLKFEVLVCEGELLPMEWMTIPASETYGKMKVSWNAHNARQVFDALLWLYADKDPGLTLASGVLRSGSTQLASGTGTSNPNAIRYIYSKMGYDLLSGAALNYVNEETRLGLSPSGERQYAYKIVEDAQ